MALKEDRALFERTHTIGECAVLTFRGVDGYDVYNTSIPFLWRGGRYIFGRVERRNEWARSWVRLFERTGPDEWTLVPHSMIFQLEDPFICTIGTTLVLGGTHVRYTGGAIDTYYGYFYRGSDLHDLTYFTTGPEHMKDIRLVQLRDGRIGVFSRPRSPEIKQLFGSESQIGFAIIDRLDDLNANLVQSARYIPGLFEAGEWGGCNQAYLLESGMIGVVGHKSYHDLAPDGSSSLVYVNISFVFDPVAHEAFDLKIIGTRSCFPDGPAKRPDLTDCAFASGIEMRPDGRADLYSGIGDTGEGRTVIEYPFTAYGPIVSPRDEMKAGAPW
jgi:Protein of unknown function (DUF1861)